MPPSEVEARLAERSLGPERPNPSVNAKPSRSSTKDIRSISVGSTRVPAGRARDARVVEETIVVGFAVA
jgi:hypothetical protein